MYILFLIFSVGIVSGILAYMLFNKKMKKVSEGDRVLVHVKNSNTVFIFSVGVVSVLMVIVKLIDQDIWQSVEGLFISFIFALVISLFTHIIIAEVRLKDPNLA